MSVCLCAKRRPCRFLLGAPNLRVQVLSCTRFCLERSVSPQGLPGSVLL